MIGHALDIFILKSLHLGACLGDKIGEIGRQERDKDEKRQKKGKKIRIQSDA